MDHKTKIAFNTMAGGVTRVIGLAVAFITTPIMISTLGDQGFGLFTLIGALTAYVGLLDFGIGPGLVRHYTEFTERRAPHSVREITTFSVCFYLVLFVVVLGPLYLVAPVVCDFMGLPAEVKNEAVLSLVLMFTFFILSCVGGIFGSRLISLHRLDLFSLIGLLGQILYAGLVIFALPHYPSLVAAILFNLIQVLCTGTMMLMLVKWRDGSLFCNPFSIPSSLVRKILIFGGWMQINSLAAIVSLELDTLIIARFLGVAVVTPYQVGNRVATLNRMLPLQFLSAIVPTATINSIRGRGEELERFYVRMSRYLMVMTLAITGFVFADADRLILAWIGRPYPEAVLVAMVLAVSYAINNLTGVGGVVVRAAEMPRYETYYGLVCTLLNIVFTIALAPYFGLAGIIGGTVIASAIGSIYFLALFGKVFSFPWYRSMGSWLLPLVAVTALSALSVTLVHSVFPPEPAAGRIIQLCWLVVEGTVFTVAFAAGLFILKFWTPEEVAVFLRAVPCLRRTAPL